jgi:4-hydroxybenzoate polyprenyltransferase
MMKHGVSILDYVFVMRPTLLFPVWTIFLAGFSAQGRFGTGLVRMDLGWFSVADYILVGVLITLCMGAAFVLNQVADVASDSYNDKLFLVANGDVSRREAVVETITLFLLAVVSGFLLKPTVGAALLLCFLVAGVLYSCPPFLFKDRPHMGFLANGIGALLVFSTGWLIRGTVEAAMWIHALPYIFALWSVYFFTTLPDIDGDRRAGKITVGVRYGVPACMWAAFCFELATIVSAYLVRDYLILFPALLSLPLFVLAIVRRTVADGVRVTKFGLLFVALAYCYKFPGFFPLLLLVFLACKWYYKKRFGISYPSFAAG